MGRLSIITQRSTRPAQPRTGQPGDPPAASDPCANCPNRDKCSSPCPALEALLPGARRAEQFPPIPNDVADAAGQWRQEAGQEKRKLFRIFLAHRDLITAAQWRCVELVYGDDLSSAEAAEALGLEDSTVRRNLGTARRRLLRKLLETYTDLRTGGGTGRRAPRSSRRICADPVDATSREGNRP